MARLKAQVSQTLTNDLNKLASGYRSAASKMTLPGQTGELPASLAGGIGDKATASLQMWRKAQTDVTVAEAAMVAKMREADSAASAQSGSFGKLTAGAKGMVVPLLAVGTAVAGAHKVMAETIAYENLIARLSGVTGGADEAVLAFNRLEEISDGTIFTENQLTEAFLHLKQTGLDASEKSLKAFANIASATGQSMDQLAEMTLSASMGIFRSMQSMGIRAVADGNKVRLTFKGVTTTIGNSAREIQEYLVKIGETDFAGAAARQLDTMGGAVKRLEDSWGDLFRELGRNAVGEFIQTGMKAAASAVDGVTAAVEALFYTMSKKPKEMSAAKKAILAGFLGEQEWGATQGSIEERYAALMGKQEAAFTNKGEQQRLEEYRARVKEIKELSWEAMQGGYAFDERTMLKAAEQEYIRGAGGKGSPPAAAKKETESLEDWEYRVKLLTKKAIEERDALTDKEAQDTAQKRYDLEESLRQMDERFREEERRELEENARMREGLFDGLLTEEEELRKSYERRLADIEEYNARDIGFARESVALKARLQEDYEQKMLQLELGRVGQATQNAEALFGSLAEVSKNWGGEQSAGYRAMFATQKAFAVASATVAGGQAMAEAMKLGWPAGIPAGIAAMAQIAKAMAMISSANYSGAYDSGGFIPAGRWGIAGERGPEIVQGPAQVTSRVDTARALGQQPIKVVVAPDAAAAEQYMMSAAGERVFLALARKHSVAIRRIVGA
jgi:hypothetical protein